MTRIIVRDLPGETSLRQEHYPLRIYSSGYEARAPVVARKRGEEDVGTDLVFAFTELDKYGLRAENDDYFARRRNAELLAISEYDEVAIVERMNQFAKTKLDDTATVRILVDYSSMRRSWYAGILNWARCAAAFRRIEIDFYYASAKYTNSYPIRSVSKIVSVPGCDGHLNANLPSLAIFGLGFDGLAPLAVVDQLEPNQLFAFIAVPDVDGGSNKARAISANQEFLEQVPSPPVEFPLGSVEKVFIGLGELIAARRLKESVSLIPLGPKPHTLASIVAAIHFGSVACLHVQGGLGNPEVAQPTGDVFATRVTFLPDALESNRV